MFKGKLTNVFASAFMAAVPPQTAQAKDVTLNSGDVVTLPSCSDSEGVDVRFQFLRVMNPQEPAFIMAQSVYKPMAGPVIQFTPNMMDMPAEVIEYSAYHECLHHEEGHAREIYFNFVTTGTINISAAKLHEYELDADCSAAEQLVQKGYDEDDFRRIFTWIPDAASTSASTHPSNDERINKVLQCAEL